MMRPPRLKPEILAYRPDFFEAIFGQERTWPFLDRAYSAALETAVPRYKSVSSSKAADATPGL